MNDYGNLEVKLIESTGDFWALWDELVEDKSGFTNNRNTVLEAYKNNCLWGLQITETDSMFERGACQDTIFCKNNGNCSLYLLPCLCVTNEEGNKIKIIWTHSRARRRGFGKKIVEYLSEISTSLSITPDNPLEESLPFLESLWFTIEGYSLDI